MLADLKLGRRYDGLLYLAESARNPPALRSHRHVELELNLVVSGTISYVVGGKRITFARGVLLWLFPTQDHQLVDRTQDAKFYVAVFKPSLIARSCRSPAYADLRAESAKTEGVLQTRLSLDAFDLVRRTMESLMEGAQDADQLNREAGYGVDSDFRYQHNDPDGLNAGLHHLLLLCWRCRKRGETLDGAVRLHPMVHKALGLLSSEAGRLLRLGVLARRCGASETHLSRTFARQIGVPLTHYRISVRLGSFLDLYRGPKQMTMAEAMYAAGFGSYAQFHRVFTEAFGRGPRECLSGPAAVVY